MKINKELCKACHPFVEGETPPPGRFPDPEFITIDGLEDIPVGERFYFVDPKCDWCGKEYTRSKKHPLEIRCPECVKEHEARCWIAPECYGSPKPKRNRYVTRFINKAKDIFKRFRRAFKYLGRLSPFR